MRYAKLALVVLALLAARPAHAQGVGDFFVQAQTDSASGEDRTIAAIGPWRGAPGGLLIWKCVAEGGLIVSFHLPGSGREGEARPVAYRFDDEPWDSTTVSKLDPLVVWYLSADRVAPFTLRAKQAQRLAIRGPGDTGQVEYHYDLSRGGEALDRLSCARGTPTPGRPLPYEEGSRGANEFSVVEEIPRIQNGGEVRRLIERNYPRLLRDAGVDGRVVVRALVLESGEVAPDSVLVHESTLDAFNEAAMKVARGMRFTPARIEGGRAVRVWVLLPITFSRHDRS